MSEKFIKLEDNFVNVTQIESVKVSHASYENYLVVIRTKSGDDIKKSFHRDYGYNDFLKYLDKIKKYININE